MRFFDFSSWQGILATALSLAVFAIIGVGIRVLVMLTIQQHQQRMNRQINERLKTLIAAYRTLGGSFTGQLTVNPRHLRDMRVPGQEGEVEASGRLASVASDRPRRIRDAVETALSDSLLLGTEEHVSLAGQAASDMAAGRPIHTAELVISFRDYIRLALELDPIPETVTIPHQGPTRPQGSGGRGGKPGRGREKGGRGGGAGGGMGTGGGGGQAGDSSAHLS